jgi:hypothetical protein
VQSDFESRVLNRPKTRSVVRSLARVKAEFLEVCLNAKQAVAADIWPVPTLAEFDEQTERAQPVTKLR